MRPTAFVAACTALVLLAVLTVTFAPIGVQPAMAASSYLHTSAGKLYDASSRQVNLSGLNWFGLETANNAPHGLWSRSLASMLDQIKSLGYNVIRLPFSDAVLQTGVMPNSIDYTLNPDLTGLTSLQLMDKIVSEAGVRGIRIILDNHRSTPGGGPEANGLWYTTDYPESTWLADWKMLANRYKGNATVIGADLRNEPHGDACWGCGDTAKDWRLAAERAGNAVLAIEPHWLIFVEGVSTFNGESTWWGGNLLGARQYPVRLNVGGRLVYSPHEYPASVSYQPWFADSSYPANMPGLWDHFWGYLQKGGTAPIMVGEFGSRLQTTSDQQWWQAFTSYIGQNRLGWTLWSLNPDSGDTGGLLEDDWKTVVQVKQDALKPLQYEFLDSGVAPAPTQTPLKTATPTRAPTATPTVRTASLLIADFESGTAPGWSLFSDPNTLINARLVSPGHLGNYAFEITASIAANGWGGAQRLFGTPRDWRGYANFTFWFKGDGSGRQIRVEILDNRQAGSTSDTSERFAYTFTEDFTGWKAFVLPWSSFARRTDWQPAGAPDDGFGRAQIWGFNFSVLSGSARFQLDDIKLTSP